MADVFISFVHEDQRVAAAVQRYLTRELKLKDGVFISSDQKQVFAGENWLDRIKTELFDARVVVLMLSQRSVRRPWVNFEAGAAWLTNKAIIPVCYGNLTKDKTPRPYSGLQSLNLPIEKYYLLKSVAHHLGLAPPPPETSTAVVERMGFTDVVELLPATRTLPSVAPGGEPYRSVEERLSIEAALEDLKDET